MPSVAELRIRPSSLGSRVLQEIPDTATPGAAARAVRSYLLRKRPGLAQALEIGASGGRVVLRARGEAPKEMLQEALELLELAKPPVAEEEIEVGSADFSIEVSAGAQGSFPEREVLHSTVRYFPHPVCEWFEITTGDLTLSTRQILYEPEWTIMQDEHAHKSGQHLMPLDTVLRFWRGEWWDVPCLMVQTPRATYRYGWPAERGELDKIFDVDEWLERLRDLLGDRT